jgi:hypothetical protein
MNTQLAFAERVVHQEVANSGQAQVATSIEVEH